MPYTMPTYRELQERLTQVEETGEYIPEIRREDELAEETGSEDHEINLWIQGIADDAVSYVLKQYQGQGEVPFNRIQEMWSVAFEDAIDRRIGQRGGTHSYR